MGRENPRIISVSMVGISAENENENLMNRVLKNCLWTSGLQPGARKDMLGGTLEHLIRGT
jgi:hypothetical protein